LEGEEDTYVTLQRERNGDTTFQTTFFLKDVFCSKWRRERRRVKKKNKKKQRTHKGDPRSLAYMEIDMMV